MKKVKIKNLSIVNFKGIQSLELTDLSQETFIFGANGSGKTTIFDSFLWLLFGKNSEDNTKFEIKPLNSNGNPSQKIDVVVSAVLDVNGEVVEIKRTLVENWVKKRGEEFAEFTGNKLTYEYNGIPLSQKEFNSKISNIIDEKVFKLITNPLAFNSMKWQDQRDMLISIAGGVTDQEIAGGNSDYLDLLSKLGDDKSLEEYGKQIAATIKKSKDELKMIPTRIDEAHRSKVEVRPGDVIQQERAELIAERDKIDSALADVNEELKGQQDALKELRDEKDAIADEARRVHNQMKEATATAEYEFNAGNRELKSKLAEAEREVINTQSLIDNLESDIRNNRIGIKRLEEKLQATRQKWHDVNSEKFVINESFECPTCNRELDPDVVKNRKVELAKKFNDSKAERLSEVDRDGALQSQNKTDLENANKDLETKKEKAQKELIQLQEAVDAVKKQMSGDRPAFDADAYLKNLIDSDENLQKDKARYEELEQEIANFKIESNNEALLSRKREINNKMDELSLELSSLKSNQAVEERIEELKKREQNLAQIIAGDEREQFVIENFIKDKIDKLEQIINGRFKMVNFRLFETQINGGQTETCKALINGVPFADANTASKINAGIDIINTLCSHFDCYAPIFIDNRESVTDVIATESQVINLVVSDNDATLRIENK